MEWISVNWELVAIAILLIDKIVALTPTKHDDLLWTGVKAIIAKIFPGKQFKK